MSARVYGVAAVLVLLGTLVVYPVLGICLGFGPWLPAALIGPALAAVFAVLAFRAADAAPSSVVSRARKIDRHIDQIQDRHEAHDLGLPFIESDGEISWPPVAMPKPTPEHVHRDLHARRLAAQPEIVHVPGAGWTIRHRN